jgi:hypothetical protein
VHGSSYGYLYESSQTLDDDLLDEWGTVHELRDLVRGSKGMLDDMREGTYNQGMTRDEGNVAFGNYNPSTGRPGGTGAFNVTASQSSSLSGSPDANVAIDGNTDDQYNSRTCTHTIREANPWWKVDLGEVRTVSEVRLYNLGGHNRFKMEHIEVYVGNGVLGHNDNLPCGKRLTLKRQAGNHHILEPTATGLDGGHMVDEGGILRLACPQLPTAPISPASSTANETRGGGLTGRYVTVRVMGQDKVLHLCEVHVIGSLLMAPAIDQGAHRRYGLDQGGGVPVDPCSVDLRMQSSGVTRLCHE